MQPEEILNEIKGKVFGKIDIYHDPSPDKYPLYGKFISLYYKKGRPADWDRAPDIETLKIYFNRINSDSFLYFVKNPKFEQELLDRVKNFKFIESYYGN